MSLYNTVILIIYITLNGTSKAVSKITAIVIISILLSSITISILAWNYSSLDPQHDNIEPEVPFEEPTSLKPNPEPEIPNQDPPETDKPTEPEDPNEPEQPQDPTTPPRSSLE